MTAVSNTHRAPRKSRRTAGIPWRKAKWFYFFIAPWLISLIVLTLVPMVIGLLMSLSNFNGLNFDKLRIIGIANYTRALGDENAWFALKRTFIFALLNIPLNIVFALSIAWMLTQRLLGQGVFRTLFYLPTLVPIAATVWIWKMMFDNNFGVVNSILDAIAPGTYVKWMTLYPTYVLTMLTLWGGLGGAIIIFMAGLQGVPKELDEAARIDGANTWHMFRSIVVPFITPVIFYQLIMSIIATLQVLVQPLLLAPGSSGLFQAVPPRENYFYAVHAYFQIFTELRYGYGSALLWILFVIIMLLTLIVFRTSRRWVYYEVEQEDTRA